MKCLSCLVLACGAYVASALSTVTAEQVSNPLYNLVAMIQALQQKAAQEAMREAQTYAAFQASIARTQRQVGQEIQAAQQAIQNTQSSVEAKQARQAAMARQVAQGQAEQTQLQSTNQEAAADRAEAQALFGNQSADAGSTVAAVEQALAGLEASQAAPTEAPAPVFGSKQQSLLQAERMVAKSLVALPLLLTGLKDDEEVDLLRLAGEKEEPTYGEEPAYEFKAGSIMDLLKKILREIQDKQQALEMEELKAKTEYELAKAGRDDALGALSKALKEKSGILAQTESDLNAARRDLSAAKADFDEATKTLKDTETAENRKAQEFKDRECMREQEKRALDWAKETLAKVAGKQGSSSASLVQLQGLPSKASAKKANALAMLRKEANILKSADLMKLADRIGVSAKGAQQPEESNPEVGKDIDITLEKQIWKLKDEQLADDKKKQWCAAEINKTEIEKKFKEDDLSELSDKIALAEANLAKLGEDIDEATSIVEAKKKEIHEATSLRQDGKNEAKLAVEDAQEAQEALSTAIATLEKFYKDAQDAAAAADETISLLQDAADVSLKKCGSGGGYLGVPDGSKGSPGSAVLLLLENTAADLAKMEADTSAQESQDQAAFDEQVKDLRADMVQRQTEADTKTTEKSRIQQKLTELVESQKLTDRQQASLESYLKDIQDQCFGGNYSTFEVRAEQRATEIEDLKASRETIQEAFAPSASAATKLSAEGTAPSSRTFLARVKPAM